MFKIFNNKLNKFNDITQNFKNEFNENLNESQ